MVYSTVLYTCEPGGERCPWAAFSHAEILVLAAAAGAGGMAPPTSTRISARLKRVQEHSSPVSVVPWCPLPQFWHEPRHALRGADFAIISRRGYQGAK